MTPRYVSKNLVGAAAMLALGASLAFAQDTSKTTPRSQRRIPISKEGPGGAATARVDTVTQTVYKTDTLRLQGRTDTVRVAGPATTMVVHDTVQLQPMVPPARFPTGVYFGLAGGVSAPNRAIFNPNSAGAAGQAQLGWQSMSMPLGIRFDANYTSPGEDSQYAYLQADPSILNLSGDVKLALPIFRSLTGSRVHFGLYAIGGGTYVSYKDLPIRLNPGVAGGVGALNVAAGSNDWQHHAAWNYGGGASLKWSNKELFFETRIIDFNTDNTPTIRQIPFMLGFNIYSGSR